MNSNKILIITGDAGESFETLYAQQRLTEAGFIPLLAAPQVKRLNLVIHDFEPGWDTYVERPGCAVESDLSFNEVKVEEYLAVLFLGGRAPEYLRNNPLVLNIAREFYNGGKFVFAICHGIQILVAAGLVQNKNVTCYEHVKLEVEAGGGIFIGDQEAVTDGRLVTGQTWQSHPQFYSQLLNCLETVQVSN